MVDDDAFKTEIERRMDEDLIFFMKTYLEKGAHESTYTARNTVLLKYFPQTDVRRMKVLDCQSSVVEVLKKVFVESFPSAVIKAPCDCTSTKKRNAAVLCIDDSELENIENGAKFDLMNTLQAEVCETCQMMQAIDEKTQMNDLIFIDMKDQCVKHTQIPQVILIQNKIFILYSIVESVNISGNKANYVAHIRRSNQVWYTFDNHLKKISTTKWNDKDKKIHLLCYCGQPEIPKKKMKKSSTPLRMIENFHSCKVSGIKINVNNVCGPDTLLHIFCNIYSDARHLFDEKDQKDRILSLIRAFHLGDQEQVYFQRALLLLEKRFESSVVNFSEITVNCDSNIYSTLKLLCSENYPSATIFRTCKCETIVRNLSIIEVDIKMLSSNGIESLSSCIVNPKSMNQTTCSVCARKFRVRTTFADIIFIDIQPIITLIEAPITLPEIKLTLIPQTIELGEKRYRLKGVIEYQPMAGRSHYTSHCLTKNEWIEYNDLLENSRLSDINATIQPHMLVFILNSI